LSFLQGRAGIDLALYKQNTINQILPVTISFATGYSSKYINAGEIENKGVELQLTGTPVKLNDFAWDITLNWAKNVIKLLN
jgi:outer membrane receptor protein involved in Fe transport